jgi:hypothetical protein
MMNERECSERKTYAQWPVHDPYLRALEEKDARTAELVRQLGNRTMAVAGDSVSSLDFRGLRCAIQRAGLERSSFTRRMLPTWRQWGQNRSLSCCGQTVGTKLGGQVVFVGVYKYNATIISFLLDSFDVVLLNYGLHYQRDTALYRSDLTRLFEQVLNHTAAQAAATAARGGAPVTRVLFRETTAQHFKGTGHWVPGAERIGRGGCSCSGYSGELHRTNFVATHNAVAEQLARQLTAGQVPIVPFYNLTAPRYDMHNQNDWCGHGASNHKDKRKKKAPPPSCCDCTHFCYTPQLYDAYFAGVERALERADSRESMRHTLATAGGVAV